MFAKLMIGLKSNFMIIGEDFMLHLKPITYALLYHFMYVKRNVSLLLLSLALLLAACDKKTDSSPASTILDQQDMFFDDMRNLDQVLDQDVIPIPIPLDAYFTNDSMTIENVMDQSLIFDTGILDQGEISAGTEMNNQDMMQAGEAMIIIDMMLAGEETHSDCQPHLEICDGSDNDCDEMIDEGEVCQQDTCAEVESLCDQVDEDCDGRIDEDVICPDERAPEIAFTLSTTQANPNQAIYVSIEASDEGGDVSLTLTLDAIEIPIILPRTELTIPIPGIYRLRLQATDPAGNHAELEQEILVFDPMDETPPEADFTNLENNLEINAPFSLQGTVNDTDLYKWFVEYRSIEQDQWYVITQGVEPIIDDEIATFDPMLMLNGTYQVRLRVIDTSGNQSIESRTVRVRGETKIGNFSITYTDLHIDLAGIPITIQRTYDSRNRRQSDFGIGWSLDIKQGKYENTTVTNEGWSIESGGVFGGIPCSTGVDQSDHLTDIRLSDQEIYTFRMKILESAILSGGCDVVLGFEFLSSTVPGEASLEILESGSAYWSNGRRVLLETDFTTLYEISSVRLTTPYHREIDFNATRGVFRMADQNGHSLDIQDHGIFHSDGRSVLFDRDEQGRITQITDPNGATLSYEYNRHLLSVFTNRDNQSTSFVYEGDYLISIHDPTGHIPSRQLYDEQGRLTALLTADGNRIELNHDIDARQEVIIDRLGNSAIYAYDENGYITQVTDPLGGTHLYTYDEEGRRTLELNPLNHETRFIYDDNGRLIEEIDAMLGVQRWEYTDEGRLDSYYNTKGFSTQSDYDSAGNIISYTDFDGGETRYTYDSRGNRLTMINPLGGVTHYTYNDLNQKLSETTPLGIETRYTYDANSNILSKSVTRTTLFPNLTNEVLVTEYQYDVQDREILKTFPDGSTYHTTYDARGLKVMEMDELGRQTHFHYDGLGRLISKEYPDDLIEQSFYDAEDQRIAFMDRAAQRTHTSYDAVGRVIAITYADYALVENRYDSAGRHVEGVDANGYSTLYEYDARDQIISKTMPDGTVWQYRYDEVGNRTEMTDPLGAIMQWTYDAKNRLIQTRYPDLSIDNTSYDLMGNKISFTDRGGRITGYEYDVDQRLIAIIDAVGARTEFDRDQLGDVIAVTNPLGHVIRYRYDGRQRLIEEHKATGEIIRYTYDLAGQLTQKLDAAQRSTQWIYDQMGRHASIQYSDGTQEFFEWTNVGKCKSFTNYDGETTWFYDPRHRVIEKRLPQGQVLKYQYDSQGNPIEEETPQGINRWSYDMLNRPIQVDYADRSILMSYDAVGRLSTRSFPNQLTQHWSYDIAGQLVETEVLDANRTVIENLQYTLAPGGERIAVRNLVGEEIRYLYDERRNLIEEDHDQGIVIRYTYDMAGNRIEMTRNAMTYTYDYDESERLTQVNQNHYLYNMAGDLSAIETRDINDNVLDTTQIIIDEVGRLRSWIQDRDEYQFMYDAKGHLQTETLNGSLHRILLYDEKSSLPQVLETYTGSNELEARYLQANGYSGEQRGEQWHFALVDGQNSAIHLSNERGEIAISRQWSAFGEALSDHDYDTPFGFLGEYRSHKTNGINLRARWYMPQFGRFLTSDPESIHPTDPANLHRFVYAGNDPLNRFDPSGRFSLASLSVAVSINSVLSSIALSHFTLAFLTVKIIDALMKPGFELRYGSMYLMASSGHAEIHAFASQMYAFSGVLISAGSALIGLSHQITGFAQSFMGLSGSIKNLALASSRHAVLGYGAKLLVDLNNLHSAAGSIQSEFRTLGAAIGANSGQVNTKAVQDASTPLSKSLVIFFTLAIEILSAIE
jgi:RHS repeat-associated protein